MRVRLVRSLCAVTVGFSSMVIVTVRLAESLVAPESHHHQPRHVNCCQHGCDCADEPERFSSAARQMACAPDSPKDFVFRKEACPDGQPADRQPARAHGQPGDWPDLTQVVHDAPVLIVMLYCCRMC